MNRDKFFIGGDWVDPAGTDTLAVISPATEEVIAKVPDATTADVDRAVAAAREAFDSGPWPQMSPAERADVMAALSGILQGSYEEIAQTISEEMGSPISFSVMGQVFAATMVLDYYTGLAREYAFEERRAGVLGPTLVRREPVGVVGAIVPWNVPLFVTMLKLAPGARVGLDRGAEAGAGDAARRLPPRRGRASRPGSRPACSTSCRRVARSVSTSSRTPTSTRSRSPVRPSPARRSPRSAASS